MPDWSVPYTPPPGPAWFLLVCLAIGAAELAVAANLLRLLLIR